MPAFTATIRHHSIARARVIEIEGTLDRAKRQAWREFQGDFNDYVISIRDREGREVAVRKLDARRWTEY